MSEAPEINQSSYAFMVARGRVQPLVSDEADAQEYGINYRSQVPGRIDTGLFTVPGHLTGILTEDEAAKLVQAYDATFMVDQETAENAVKPVWELSSRNGREALIKSINRFILYLAVDTGLVVARAALEANQKPYPTLA